MSTRGSIFGALICILLGGGAWAQVTQRVNVSASGAEADGWSDTAAISVDGRWALFESTSWNLVSGDTNGWGDVFVRDLRTGTIERVSVASDGTQGDMGAGRPSISADGRFVAFESLATNLVPGDTNGTTDVFVHDRQSGVTDRVSVDSLGGQGNEHSGYASISADGRYVAFWSQAWNLVSGDTPDYWDVFVHDRITGATEIVDVDSSGLHANGGSLLNYISAISADGRYVVFHSDASNLVPGDTNNWTDVFVRDRVAGTTERVSLSSTGTQADWPCEWPTISVDGRFVAFHSLSSVLVGGDTNGAMDIFVRDRTAGTTERVSVGRAGRQTDGHSFFGVISADGRHVAFDSWATNLVSGDTNDASDVFLRDRLSGTTERVSVASGGLQGNAGSRAAVVSGDGRCVLFGSDATNLVGGDLNGRLDIFVRDRVPSGFTSLCSPGLAGVVACPCSNPPSGPGRGCNNSAATGGAILSAAGVAYVSSDTLVFTTSGEKPTALSIVTQWLGTSASGIVFGMGVRCTSGNFKRLYNKAAVGGSITAPSGGDPSVSVRSAALGDPILAGQSRWYLVHYRDQMLLGGCPLTSNFNATQTGQVTWSP